MNKKKQNLFSSRANGLRLRLNNGKKKLARHTKGYPIFLVAALRPETEQHVYLQPSTLSLLRPEPKSLAKIISAYFSMEH